MKTEMMIEELYKVAEKHKADVVGTGELNIHAMCTDVAKRLEELSEQLRAKTVKMIPCHVEMPPVSDELLLIQCSGKPVPNIIFDDAFALGSYTNEGWIAEEYPEWDSIAVSAWSPLLESYVGEMKCERQQSEPDWKQSMMRTFLGGTT